MRLPPTGVDATEAKLETAVIRTERSSVVSSRVGALRGRYDLACDNLVAADVLTAEGHLVGPVKSWCNAISSWPDLLICTES